MLYPGKYSNVFETSLNLSTEEQALWSLPVISEAGRARSQPREAHT